MDNLAGWQRPTKTFFSPIPAGNWNMELPQQMLASIGKYGFWNYYLNTGDAESIIRVYPNVKDYLSIWQTDADGLIVHRSGENGWDWCDWGDNVDTRVLDNAWFCLALEGAAHMAKVAGFPEDANAYLKQRESIIAAVNRMFWNGSAYRDPNYKGATDDRANGLAVVSGIAGHDKYPAIKAVLSKEFHASPYMEKYILESLFLMDDASAALERMQSRYKDIVASELTTLPELFGPAGTNNHAWSGGPLTLLSQYVCGVAPLTPGFEKFQVMPQPGHLTNASASFETVKGFIATSFQKMESKLQLKVTVPATTNAIVGIPASGAKSIKLNKKLVWKNGKYINITKPVAKLPDNRICVEVPSGDWIFTVEY